MASVPRRSVPSPPTRRRRGRGLRILGKVAAVLAILSTGSWAGLALLYAPVLPEPPRLPFALAVAALTLASLAGVFARRLRPAIGCLGLAAALTSAGWMWITPSQDGDWPPEVRHLTRASIDGDRVTIRNVRNFDWQGTDRFIERWEDRSYSLASLNRLDLITSYWAGPHVAHVMLSFGFDTGEQLVASIEVRRRRDQEYSTLKGFFRNFELIYILGDERDLIRLRTTFRKERVYLYRLRTPPTVVRRVFLEYLRTVNGLAAEPRFYNTLTTNCTTQIRMAGIAAGLAIPWDWRLLPTGHTPEFLYARGSPDTRLPFEELRRRAEINDAADRAGGGALFSQAIRQDVPDPLR